MTIHIMLDLETWGTTPGCDIRSIGACVFDPVKGMVGDHIVKSPGDESSYRSATGALMRSHTCDGFYIACDNPVRPDARPQYADQNAVYADRKYPLHRDPRTVQWWSEQTDEAQAAFADPVDLREALMRFSRWFTSFSESSVADPSILPWSHGPQFDISILAAAYEAVGLPVPWHYRAPRDTRTLFDVAGIDDHSAWLNAHPGPMGVTHHALDDAICQARAVCAAWGRVAEWRRQTEIHNQLKESVR